MSQSDVPVEDAEIFLVSAEEEGVRIDKLLAAKFSNYSRTYFQNLVEQGCVLINGEKIKKRHLPEEGDEIEICFQITEEISLEPEKIPLEILYEDEHLLAVNKPVGMVVHPAPGHWKGTFVNALLAHCKEVAPCGDPLRPGIVHRLDKETSGVLLAAKTRLAHQKLIELFSTRKIEKLYLAICYGRPLNTTITAPIGRHPVHRKEMTALPDGREAVTEIQVAATNDRFSLILARPKTGRTHQIRVHLKHVGAPVVGDRLYGNASEAERHLLHAYRLVLEHPITGAILRITAPIPQDMRKWMEKLCQKEPLLKIF